MHIIDIHSHIYPDAIAEKAAESIREFYQLDGSNMTGTVDMLLQQGGKAGISQYLILPVGLKPDHVRHINTFAAEQTAAHEEFIGFGTVHAGMEDLIGEVEYIQSLGLRGIKMHPDSQMFAIDDPRLFDMYEHIQGKLPLCFHMGDQRYDYSHPARLRHILDLFPRLQVIGAHFGGYSMFDTALQLLKDKNCIFDSSSSLMFMEESEPEKFINAYGAERIAYGSDYPLWDPVVEVERFLKLKLTDDQFEQIFHKTAETFLNL